MAEAHPVGFRWVMKARERGAKIIHVDPRFGRTSAVADQYVPIRAGSDIAFVGGLIRHVIETESYFRDYVLHYTNASTLIDERFQDTEDLSGVFSGFDPETGTYDRTSWMYEGGAVASAAGTREHSTQAFEEHTGAGMLEGAIRRDETLQHPRCVLQIVRRHFARYTPEMVSRVCGISEEDFHAVADALIENSGPERTTALAYAVGWTQHSTGVQMIRAGAILQLLLGNIGRPGGGIMAMRGHATIQGASDIPTLYDLLPGYLHMPRAREHELTLSDYVESGRASRGWWSHFDNYIVSLLKAWYGDAATPENDFGFAALPKISGNHAHFPTMLRAMDGGLDGLFAMGQNPAVGSQNSGLMRRALAHLRWLVVRDLAEIETATFWRDSPEVRSGELRTEDIQTEVFLMPGATHVEKEGSFTNTQRLVQWRDKALEAPRDARSELWFMHHLTKRVKAHYAGSQHPRDWGIRNLTWDYREHGPEREPSVEDVLKEINGVRRGHRGARARLRPAQGRRLDRLRLLDLQRRVRRRRQPGAAPQRRATSTRPAAGCRPSGRGRGRPTGASSTTAPRPTRTAAPGRSASATSGGTRTREAGRATTCPTSPSTSARTTGRRTTAGRGWTRSPATEPFIMMGDGRAWLYSPSGLLDGPLPTHYEPIESPVPNALYPEIGANPVALRWQRPDNPYNPSEDPRYPLVATTFRLTEHHTAGAMSRNLPWLAELQPEMFAEIDPALARDRGIEDGDWMTVVTERAEIEARAVVTERMRPLWLGDRVLHQVALPWHWGYGGGSTGDAANDLIVLSGDPNTTIEESKAFSCDVRAGRRRREPTEPLRGAGPATARIAPDEDHPAEEPKQGT